MGILQNGVVEVQLTRGLVTIIDAEDLGFVSQWKWCAQRNFNTSYAKTSLWIPEMKKYQNLSLHRVLLNALDGMHVDHCNHDGLDNRRSNLRLCTPGENRRNSSKQKGGSSEFKGVSKRQDGVPKSWQACIYADKKRHTKCFLTELEAALWYDEMAKELHGEFANLNF